MIRFATAAAAVALASLAAVPAAVARPADVNIVSSVPLTTTTTVVNTVRVSTTPQAPTPIVMVSRLNPGVAQRIGTDYTVPAGKDLIITQVSGYFGKFLGDNSALQPRFMLLRPDGSDGLAIPLASSNPSFYSFSLPYVGVARSDLGMNVYRDDTTNSAEAKFIVMGYLVNEGSAAATASAAGTSATATSDATQPQR